MQYSDSDEDWETESWAVGCLLLLVGLVILYFSVMGLLAYGTQQLVRG